MEPLEAYEIPENFQEPTIRPIRSEADSYVETFTAMIHIEEIEARKHVKQFDLTNIQLKLIPRSKNIFEIKIDVSTIIIVKRKT